MERGEYRPDGEQFGEGSEFQPYAALRKRGNLRLPTPVGTYTMLIDTWFEKHGEVSEEQSDSMWRVAVGFGFLVYDHMPETKQAVFLNILYNMREHNKEWAQAGREVELHSLTLSQEDADTLRDIASAVNIDYDPGDETTPEKRIFPFADVESNPPDVTIPYLPWYTEEA